jgi:transposase
MAIFVGLDVHRAQITYNVLDTDSGEVKTGRIRPANRATVRAFLAPLATKKTIVAVEAMTDCVWSSRECARAGIEVRLAEPAETRERHDRKRRAKTDKLDVRLLRELLMQGRLPESWIAPAHILDLRAKLTRPCTPTRRSAFATPTGPHPSVSTRTALTA